MTFKVDVSSAYPQFSCPMYLILLSYKVPIEEVERVTPAHREFLDRAYKAEKFIRRS